MKKSMKKIISFALMLSLLVGMMAGFNVFAAEEEATVEIVSKNVYYADNLRLMYAVKAPAGAEVTVNIYGADNELLGEATPGDGTNVPETQTINGVECFIFVSDFGVPAQEIDTVFYAEAVADGVKSEKVKYSVLEYLYERLVGTKATTNQRVMYNNLLAYADSLAAVLIEDGKSVDRISEYAYVRVENGTVDGTYSSAMLKAGTALDKLTTDYVVESGKVLAWKINAYEIGKPASETIVKDDAIAEFIVESGKVYDITPTSVESGAASSTTTATTIADYAALKGWTNESKYETINLDANVTVTANGGGNTGKYYSNGYNWRLYQGESATMTIAAVEGKKIITVKVGYDKYNTGILTLNGITVESEEEITVNAPSITFVVGNSGSATNGQARIKSIEVVYTDVPAHDCQFSEATCTAPKTCSICGKTDGQPLEHSYDDGEVTTPATCTTPGVMTYTCTTCPDTYTEAIPETGHTTDNGVCTACGQQIGGSSVAEEITVSKTVADLIKELEWTSSTTKQSFTLDEVVSVKVDGGSNSGKAYDNDHIRIYATDNPAGSITITLAEGYELISIKITTKTSGSSAAFLKINGNGDDISGVSTEVSGSEVVVKSVKNGNNGKNAQVLTIEVVYRSTEK